MLTASYNSHLYGEQIIDMAMKILNGEEVEPVKIIPTTVVDRENCEEYIDPNNTVY